MSKGISDPDPQRQIEDLKQRIAGLESALLESEKNFRTLTDSAPVGIYLDNAEGKATYINKKCAELVGVPAENALDFGWIPYLHPDDRDRMVSAWQKAFQNSEEFHLEYRWVHADGKVVWTLGEVVPILGDDGKATMFIGTLTDITERKQAEMEKERLEAQLVQAQKMESIGRLAGGIAHDYNNMLSVIISYTQLALAEVEQSGSVYGKLQEVLKAATRSAEVTRQLLSFARKQVVVPELFDINDAVKDMLNMIRRLIGTDIDLIWSPDAGPHLIKLDPAQLDQIVVNLCINARDAINGVGKIAIKTAKATVDDPDRPDYMASASGDFIRLTVSDNGSGMDKTTLDNVFEPFFTTKAKDVGVGLGLASVYGIVKQNNGFIDVRSGPGQGTTFEIYLPEYTGELPADPPPAQITAHRGAGKTILLVEDEVAILDAVTGILEDFDYIVLAANHPSKALTLLRQHNKGIDLLITDVIMPGMNGRDLANQIRLIQPNIKCLFMSGYTADVIAGHGVLDKDTKFIQKPFRVEALIASVSEILNPTPL